MTLTDLTIRGLKPSNKLYRRSDGNGLCIEITPSGSKLWRWRYTYQGTAQMLALGAYPAISLAEARRLRDEQAALLAKGLHPTREKKARRLLNQQKDENTFEVVARMCMCQRQTNFNEKYREQCMVRLEQKVFPYLGAMPITAITTPDVVKVMQRIVNEGHAETARRMGQLISQTFRYATHCGLCPFNPAVDLKGILPPNRVETHHACISLEQLPQFLSDVRGYKGDRRTFLAIRLMMLTMLRTSEVIRAPWNEIVWDAAEWRIPAPRMKKRRAHTVPLSRQAIDVLAELHDLHGNRPFIFPSERSESGHISDGAILMAFRRMGYAGEMTGHGFRTLGSTILNEKGYNPDAIEAQLAHLESNQVRRAYNRADYLTERKTMMQDYADYLDNFGSNRANNVVPIRRG